MAGERRRLFYYVVLGVIDRRPTPLPMRAIIGSRFGRVLRGTRENAVRMQAIGFPPFPYQLTAYVIAGTCMAAIAGVLLANQAEFVSPAYMTWQRSGELIMMVVDRRHGHADRRHSSARSPSCCSRNSFPSILPALEARPRRHPDPASSSIRRGGIARLRVANLAGFRGHERSPPAQTRLLKKNLSARWPSPTRSRSMSKHFGELHAIIGPNGAGKTTLIHQLSGSLPADARARSLFNGRTSPGLPWSRRVQLGLARTFQITSILDGFSPSWRTPPWRCRRARAPAFGSSGPPARDRILPERGKAMSALATVGLDDRAETPGQQPVPWREAPARTRDRPGDRARSSCSWTSRWPARAMTNRQMLTELIGQLKGTPSASS